MSPCAKRIHFAVLGVMLLVSTQALAKNPYRKAFFDVYPAAETTQLGTLPSTGNHCGACHFDFNGSGLRNAYGLTVETALPNFSSTEDAILSLGLQDADADGFVNNVEITDTTNFSNTPTFPGLSTNNVGQVVNVTVVEVEPYLTPSGGTDTDPPVVTVTAPAGGENFAAESNTLVTYTATDASGISHIDVYMSDDGGATFKPFAKQETETGTYDFFVPNLPGISTVIRIAARDNAGNYGTGDSGVFAIDPVTHGYVPLTLRDMHMDGSQPFDGGTFEDVDQTCVTCHGNYDQAVEPWYNWRGGMMAQAMRDPLFLACVAVAEQDVPSVGDLCIRCHSPGGWLEGRSIDTSGGMLNDVDHLGVQCDFCHRLVDPVYEAGVSPAEDVDILAALESVPDAPSSAMFITDPNPVRRGPYADAQAAHQFLESPFHREDLCANCHDVSSPAFVQGGSIHEYLPDAFDTPHVDGDPRNMFPIERTFSEWSVSEYATTGVYAPQFAGDKPDGIVSTCQDCHMSDTTGRGANTGPNRTDLPLHDLTGGSYWMPDVLATLYPGDVDVAQLQDAKQRAIDILQKAASIELIAGQDGLNPTVTVTITNETGHKLPSGYPEGRRAWVNVVAYDEAQAQVYESGAYDAGTGVLTHDADVKIYEIKPGISERLGAIVGLPAGPSFHFVVNDSIYSDNRIPPRGFTNANFEQIQSPVVAYSYADGAYADATTYLLPSDARFVEVKLYYQSTTKEYVEFLHQENVTNSAGQTMYDAWVNHGRCAPITMVEDTISVFVDPTGRDEPPAFVTKLGQNTPNPFNATTTLHYSMRSSGRASVRIYDVSGRHVRTLVNDVVEAGTQSVTWHGQDDHGRAVASGVYVARLETRDYAKSVRMVLVK